MTASPTNADVTTQTSRSGIQKPIVMCAGLTKIFKDFWMRNRVRAVDNINLQVRKGEVFGLLGPNGSGKSTTIKMMLGLLHPTAGQISVFGKRPEDVDTKKMVGYLPEESYLYRFLNARETLDYYGKLFHQSRPQRERRIDMLLEMVGLDAAWRRPVGEYSKGMQRRIGLAQALINDPHLLILDEPTTGLDPLGTRQIKDLILELKRRGKTIILCSHLLADVEDVCDRACIMFGGKVRAMGTCDELLTDTDLTTFETDRLDAETIQEIEQVLSRRSKAINRVQQPRQRLEQLFLDIVNKAQAEGEATSGARASDRIAAFLRQGAEEEEVTESAEVIENLLTGSSTKDQAATADQTAQEAVTAPQDELAPKSSVVNDLIWDKSDDIAPAAHKADGVNAKADEPSEQSKPDQSLIDSLIEKPKDD